MQVKIFLANVPNTSSTRICLWTKHQVSSHSVRTSPSGAGIDGLQLRWYKLGLRWSHFPHIANSADQVVAEKNVKQRLKTPHQKSQVCSTGK
uniref:Uncharacterized protein LOC107495007 isoform X1 n=1 Tax=Rhizophora mucronata TaxID=61149 RepID=A0A2P2JUU5_RHIMU